MQLNCLRNIFFRQAGKHSNGDNLISDDFNFSSEWTNFIDIRVFRVSAGVK